MDEFLLAGLARLLRSVAAPAHVLAGGSSQFPSAESAAELVAEDPAGCATDWFEMYGCTLAGSDRLLRSVAAPAHLLAEGISPYWDLPLLYVVVPS